MTGGGHHPVTDLLAVDLGPGLDLDLVLQPAGDVTVDLVLAAHADLV